MKKQREDYEATLNRHLTMVDKLLADKKSLSEKCTELAEQSDENERRFVKKVEEMQALHRCVRFPVLLTTFFTFALMMYVCMCEYWLPHHFSMLRHSMRTQTRQPNMQINSLNARQAESLLA